MGLMLRKISGATMSVSSSMHTPPYQWVPSPLLDEPEPLYPVSAYGYEVDDTAGSDADDEQSDVEETQQEIEPSGVDSDAEEIH